MLVASNENREKANGPNAKIAARAYSKATDKAFDH
jgi:hypothetical protein